MIRFIVAFISQFVSTITAGTISASDVFYAYLFTLINIYGLVQDYRAVRQV